MSRKVLYINSDTVNRSSGSNEDFTIVKTIEEFSGRPNTCKLVSASIPYTWNNIVNFSIMVSVGNSEFPVLVSDGNYSGTQLASALTTAITDATGVQISVAWNAQISRFLFSSVIEFQITASASGNNLGLPEGIFPDSPAQAWTAPKTGVLLPFTELCICSNIVEGSDNGIIRWSANPSESGKILAIIPINICFNGIIQWTSSCELPFYSISQSRFNAPSSEIRFALKFPDGSPVNLNGYNWSAVLIIEF